MRGVFLLCFAVGHGASLTGLNFSFSDADHFAILVEGGAWLTGGGLAFRCGDRALASSDGTLSATSWSPETAGVDSVGAYVSRSRTYSSDADGSTDACVAVASFKLYESAVLFEQRFPLGALGTSAAADLSQAQNLLATEWPVLEPVVDVGLGALTFGGRFMEGSKVVQWRGAESVSLGAYGGPFALFSGGGDASVLTVSAASNFATSSMAASSTGSSGIGCGAMGSVSSLPAGYSTSTLVTYGAEGVTATVKKHGSSLLAAFGTLGRRSADPTTSLLGYSTDNGAYYYYRPNGTYEHTLLEVKRYADAAKIPYRYALLDSWWYTKGLGGGVKEWTCTAEAFPHGCAKFAKDTGWFFQLHNRMWASDTVYATQNGGDYEFILEPPLAIPTEQRFWDDLMANGSSMGMRVYEQDWMYNEFQGLNATLTSATLARNWLVGMAKGAERAGASVQYCMELARFVLQSVETAAVTQFRASDDYGASNSAGCAFPYCVYYLGTTSLLAYALELAPSKDNFWSSQAQPGNAYNDETRERFSEMQSAIAALSAGPVQVSDGLGYSDRTVILRTCTEGGELLQPSRPASALDACFAEAALTGPGPAARLANNLPVMAAHTLLAGRKWAHVLAINLLFDFDLYPRHLAPTDLDLADLDLGLVAYAGWGPASNLTLHPFDTRTPVTLKACNESDFALWHVAPLLPNGYAFLGEPAKWVSVATRRVSSLDVHDQGLTVALRGQPGEPVELAFAAPTAHGQLEVLAHTCILDGAGTARLKLSQATFQCE